MTKHCFQLSSVQPHSKFSIIIASFPNQIHNQKLLVFNVLWVKLNVNIILGGQLNEKENFWF